MITITPQGSVYLCKTPLENDYKHQLTFTNATSQLNYFTSSSVLKHTCTDFTYIKKDNQIVVDYNIDSIIDCNYLYYKNTGFTTKYYYAFITNMEYVNENATRITFEIDVYQTYMFDIQYKKSFIEREHVNDDTIGKNIIDEGLEIGDLVIHDKDCKLNDPNNFIIVIAVSNLPSGIDGNLTRARSYNGIYSGLSYLVPSSVADASKLIEAYEKAEMSEALVSMFMYYNSLDIILSTEVTWTFHEGQEDQFSFKLKKVETTDDTCNIGYASLSLPDNLNGYTPKNNKLFTSPYCFINASNNAGIVQEFKWELFRKVIDPETNKQFCTFDLESSICPGGSAKAIPMQDYAQYTTSTGLDNNFMYSIPLAKLPVCSWLSDTYTNWLTQNGIASTGLTDSLMAIGGGLITQNYIGVGVGLVGIYTALKTIQEKKNAPDIVKGNVNSGDVNFSYNYDGGFSLYNMTIKYDNAKRIDDYFNTFGYKVNEFKTPNVTGRTYWNYVKTIDCNLEGDIPQVYINKLKEMFNNGVTFWHDSTKFLDYSQNNTIVTPTP